MMPTYIDEYKHGYTDQGYNSALLEIKDMHTDTTILNFSLGCL